MYFNVFYHVFTRPNVSTSFDIYQKYSGSHLVQAAALAQRQALPLGCHGPPRPLQAIRQRRHAVDHLGGLQQEGGLGEHSPGRPLRM